MNNSTVKAGMVTLVLPLRGLPGDDCGLAGVKNLVPGWQFAAVK